MKNFIFLLIIVAVGPAIAGGKSEKICNPALAGTKPDAKTLGVGAILQLKSKVKGSIMGQDLGNILPLLDLKQTSYMGLPPGTRLKTLSSRKQMKGVSGVEVQIEGTETKGFMFWEDVRNYTSVLAAGESVEEKPKRAKFPGRGYPQQFDELSKQSLSIYKRPFAKVGDTVWVSNHSRAMSKNSVGVLKKINQPLTPGKWGYWGSAIVELLNGKTEEVGHYNCVPLAPTEIELVR